MSSARSNAAARSRRAGGDAPPPPQQMNGRPGQQIQGQQMQQMQQMQGGAKLTISDAIALITLRLGRIEQIVQNMPVDNQSDLGENSRVVDDAVLANIAQRLEALEKGQKVLAEKKPAVLAPNAPINSQLSESVDVLKAEMIQVKDLLMQLQSFTMQTNQRLSEIVFNNGEFVDHSEDCDEDIVSGNVVDDASAQALLGLQNAIVEETIASNN
jgi:hypothetical protein